MENEEQELAERSEVVGRRNKMPKVPDMGGWGITPKRSAPFILDDFKGSDAYKDTKP